MLTDREKETLRLLVCGHDAKSIARHLGLSVHTINERLRDARRKVGVSSSREAARLLAEAEKMGPQSLTDRFLGVTGEADDMPYPEQATVRHSAGYRLAWFGGGMIVMSLVIAALALSAVFHGNAVSESEGPMAVASGSPTAASLGSARDWLTLLDHARWEDSWRTAAPLFTSHISAAQWAAAITSVRQPLGDVKSRTPQTVTRSTSLPGAPAGEYEIFQFRTDFIHKSNAIETVTLVRDPAGWKVTGYFIR